MFLFELDAAGDVITKLTIIADQLKAGVEKNNIIEWPLDQLLSYLQNKGVPVDKDTLYDMIKSPPLNNVIDNIQGDKVIFKGKAAPDVPDTDKNKEIVKQMAQQAMPTR